MLKRLANVRKNRLALVSVLLAFLLYLFVSSCALTQDCSPYKRTDPKRCKCIRDNGEPARAKECSKVANKVYRERARKDCYRTCYDMIDCERCLDI